MSANAREEILAAAKLAAQAHGYAGLNFRDLAERVGIKAASIYYHFPSKAELATAVAKRYWEDDAAYLESLLRNSATPLARPIWVNSNLPLKMLQLLHFLAINQALGS